MFFEKTEEAACGWGHHPGSRPALDLGKGVAQHREFLPQSRALTLHSQTCPWVSQEGLGGGGRSGEGLRKCLLPQAGPPHSPLGHQGRSCLLEWVQEPDRELEPKAEGGGADRSYYHCFSTDVAVVQKFF